MLVVGKPAVICAACRLLCTYTAQLTSEFLSTRGFISTEEAFTRIAEEAVVATPWLFLGMGETVRTVVDYAERSLMDF